MTKEQLAQEYADKIEAAAWYTENHEVSQEVKAAVLYGYATCEEHYSELLAAAVKAERQRLRALVEARTSAIRNDTYIDIHKRAAIHRELKIYSKWLTDPQNP